MPPRILPELFPRCAERGRKRLTYGPGPCLVRRPPGGVSRFRRRAAMPRMGEAITAEDAVGEPLRPDDLAEDAVGEPLRAGFTRTLYANPLGRAAWII